jgi:hypothetical protein
MALNNTAARCTAKSKRSGKRCKNPAVAPSDKCRMHGGKSLKGIAAPAFKDGKRSKYAYLPEHLSTRVEDLSADAIKNLEENINIQRAMESRIMEQFAEGGSLFKWRQLRSLANGYLLMVETAEKRDIEPPDPENFLHDLIQAIADAAAACRMRAARCR